MTLKKIRLNKAQCNNCGDVLESKHRHDFVSCKCHNQSNININNYKGKKYTKNNLFYTKAFMKFVSKQHGIFIDGGSEYLRRGWFNIDDLKELSR